jgi:hypothetical protein
LNLFLRPSIVERMPVLISNQTSNTNNTEQQEQTYDEEDKEEINHVTTNEPVVNNLFLLNLIELVDVSGRFIKNSR